MQAEKIDQLCAALMAAKVDETEATERRVAVELQIIALTGLPEEGVITETGTEYRVKVEQRINRKIDAKRWAMIADQIPEPLRPVRIVEELKIETAGVRWLRENEPGYYKLLCSAMEEKPAKPSVKVEVVK